jgi:hypothetical protein
MFVCLDCGNKFDEPNTYSECMGEFWGTPAYEEFDNCPYCGEGAIRELSDEDEELYDVAYDCGRNSGKRRMLMIFDTVKDYIKPDMTAEQTVKMIGEWLNAKNVSELVRKYSN